jgi:hypothetical protein
LITILEVKQIEYSQTKDFILHKHYAQRMPNIKWAYGLYIDNSFEGVCTIGKPASPYLCEGICGKEYKNKVWELNRLCVNDGLPPNTLSQFVSKVLKLLKSEDIILVSYADSGAGHCGYIYQATNFYYTGKTKERTDKYAPNGKHCRHYSNEYNDYRKVRTPKYRYVYFTGKSKKIFLSKLNYSILPYPKEENHNYILGQKIKEKILNTKTGEYFYE